MIMKPTFKELAQPKLDSRAKRAFQSAIKDAQKSQEKLLKQAARLGKQA